MVRDDGKIHRVVGQKIYLGLFAFLRYIQARRGTLARYIFVFEKIIFPFDKGGLRGILFCHCEGAKRPRQSRNMQKIRDCFVSLAMTRLTFTKKVIRIVSKIPKGKTLAYKQVATRAGNSKAARAVGNILNKYYLECIKLKKSTIPCHRVIRSDGKIGGYAKGEEEKRKLLQKEKAI
jgi:methylated-DNA-[protein]-cysteine S-methyltransferase